MGVNRRGDPRLPCCFCLLGGDMEWFQDREAGGCLMAELINLEQHVNPKQSAFLSVGYFLKNIKRDSEGTRES